jgi:DNA-binding NarL/FixJ family response regulator
LPTANPEAYIPDASKRWMRLRPVIRVRTDSEWGLLDEALRLLVSSQPDIVLLRRNEPCPPGERPVVLLEARGSEVRDRCVALGRSAERPHVVVVGWDGREGSGVQALRAGARGILGRDAGTRELLKAVRVVHQGQVWAPWHVVQRALDTLVVGRSRPWDELTPREEEIARQVARGYKNREIALRMAISEATVKAHLTQVFRKLDLRGRTRLAIRYHETEPLLVAQRDDRIDTQGATRGDRTGQDGGPGEP